MTDGSRKIGKNEIRWRVEAAGGHGEEPLDPNDVATSLAGSFRFAQATTTSVGLRSPQLGALHAILATDTLPHTEPTTIVMPTGTGKTETMLAAFAAKPLRTLVVVPSDALRTQIANKFVSLGILPEVGAVVGDFRAPVVAVMRSGFATVEECDELVGICNVLVTTPAAIAKCSLAARAQLFSRTERVIFDEAHHVAASSWAAIAGEFSGRPILQFTATPFREDGKRLDGRIRYAYPLRLAQREGIFAKIEYRAISAFGATDGAVAEAALARLTEDLNCGYDHILMARVQTIPRSDRVLGIYQTLGAEFKPVRIDSKLSKKAQLRALEAIGSRESRVIVCVDMLGEGFDMPELKVAAIHDPHKSLAVTLQFVGRFARSGENLGSASVFVPSPAGDLDDRLRHLYGEDPDWNEVIRDLTEAEVADQETRSEFEHGFGSRPTEVAQRSIQPKMSTVVYRSPALRWNPEGAYDVFPSDHLLTKKIAINHADRVVWLVTAEQRAIDWADFPTFRETVHHLYIVHCDPDRGLMYINSSDTTSAYTALATAVGGSDVELIKGDQVYRVLSVIDRRVPTNIGVLDAVSRSRRFSMHVGADVLQGFKNPEQKTRTNIFAHGYRNGARASFGASRRGRIWSHQVAPDIWAWLTWARSVGPLLIDEGITVESVMDGFIVPAPADTRPEFVPLGVEWSPEQIERISEARQISYRGQSYPLIDVALAPTTFTRDGPLRFEVRTYSWTLEYELVFATEGVSVVPLSGDAMVSEKDGDTPLSAFLSKRGLVVYFEQDALLSPDGLLIKPKAGHGEYPRHRVEIADWSGIDIQSEAQGAHRDATTVQARVIELLRHEADWDVVLDDHGTREVGDVVLLRREDRDLHIFIVHCKASSSPEPGARLEDLYELCGQAAKSHRGRADAQLTLRRLIRREEERQRDGKTGFVIGDGETLTALLRDIHALNPRAAIIIVQPGLSRARMSAAQARLLACADRYLADTYASDFRVIGSA